MDEKNKNHLMFQDYDKFQIQGEFKRNISDKLDLNFAYVDVGRQSFSAIRWIEDGRELKTPLFHNYVMDYCYLLLDENSKPYGCWFLGKIDDDWSIYRLYKNEENKYTMDRYELGKCKACCFSYTFNENYDHIIMTIKDEGKEAFLFNPEEFAKKSDTFTDIIQQKSYSLTCPVIIKQEINHPVYGKHTFLGEINRDGSIKPRMYSEAHEMLINAPIIRDSEKPYDVLDKEALLRSLDNYNEVTKAKEGKMLDSIIEANNKTNSEDCVSSSVTIDGKPIIEEAFIYDEKSFKEATKNFQRVILRKDSSNKLHILFRQDIDTNGYIDSFYGEIGQDGRIKPKIYNESKEEIIDAKINQDENGFNVLDQEYLHSKIDRWMHAWEVEKSRETSLLMSNLAKAGVEKRIAKKKVV